MLNRFFKPTALALALATGLAFAAPGQAEAGSRHRDRALVAGAIGVTAGVLLGAALAQPRYGAPVYVEPDPYYEPDVVYVEPRPRYRERVRVIEREHYYEPVQVERPHYGRGYYQAGAYDAYRPAPWSDDWYAWCASKYRSFNPANGTFQPYNGPRQICR